MAIWSHIFLCDFPNAPLGIVRTGALTKHGLLNVASEEGNQRDVAFILDLEQFTVKRIECPTEMVQGAKIITYSDKTLLVLAEGKPYPNEYADYLLYTGNGFPFSLNSFVRFSMLLNSLLYIIFRNARMGEIGMLPSFCT